MLSVVKPVYKSVYNQYIISLISTLCDIRTALGARLTLTSMLKFSVVTKSAK